jgi:hypothetical protein
VAEEGAGVGVQWACESLGIPPALFRKLWDEFSDELGEPGPDGQLSHSSFEQLARIWRLRGDGHGPEAIRSALRGEEGTPVEGDSLLSRMESLHRALDHSERRRMEDRDRLMMAMIRTQQEIRDLRQELTIGRRRDRRKGFLRRLWGGGGR